MTIFMSSIPFNTNYLITKCQICAEHYDTMNMVFILNNKEFTTYFDVILEEKELIDIYQNTITKIKEYVSSQYNYNTITAKDVNIPEYKFVNELCTPGKMNHLAINMTDRLLIMTKKKQNLILTLFHI